MIFKHNLVQGQELDNKNLVEIFKCSPQGGMRKSNKTNTLILIQDHFVNLYKDDWIGDVLHYTGAGQRGDQELTHQNKTLYDSKNNNVDVYLFERSKKNRYTFKGKVELAEKPYQGKQLDADNNMRNVWIFPLKLINEIAIQEKIAEELPEKETNKLPEGAKKQIIVNAYERNPKAREICIQNYGFTCSVCEFNFEEVYGEIGKEYIHVHHLKPLSEINEEYQVDPINDLRPICPNCHSMIHKANLSIEQLRDALRENMVNHQHI
jgi:5-methylcytosine-specific restriction enzyme A